MGKASPAQVEAERAAKMLSAELRSENIRTPARYESANYDSTDNFTYHAAVFRAPVPSRTLRGDWSLTCYWRYVNAPAPANTRGRGHRGSEVAVLWDTSMGLNVSDHPLQGGHDVELCLVRYDFFRAGAGPHLNVYQPLPIKDRAHWGLPPGSTAGPWEPVPLLHWLLSPDREADLLKAGWPRL